MNIKTCFPSFGGKQVSSDGKNMFSDIPIKILLDGRKINLK